MKFKLFGILFCVLTLSLSLAIHATARPDTPEAVTYYVSSSTGSDDNDGLSEGKPIKTIAEVDNLGFNIHRGPQKNGPWEQINESLIPSNVPPGSPVGATYEWTDTKVRQGERYFYLLEDVDSSGVKTQHGPVTP